MTHGARRRQTATAVGVGIVLSALVWYETGTVRRTTSVTYDEMTYLEMGFGVRANDFEPLVSGGVAPLPVLLDAAVLGPFRPRDLESPLLLEIVDRARRLHAVASALPLVLGVYLWLLARRGLGVASWAAVCLALSPTFVAHASLATTDAAVTLWTLVTLAALAWHAHRPGPGRLALVAIALGLACAAKYSAICLLPAVVISVGWRRCLGVAAGAAVVLWASSGFSTSLLTVRGHHVEFPALLVGAWNQWARQRGGRDAFLLGHSDSSGWWYYFPVALALKCTPAELAVAVSLPLLVLKAWRRRDHAFTLWVTTIATFAVALLAGRVDIGVRYALPLWPLAVLCVADASTLVQMRPFVRTASAVIIAGAQAFSSMSVSPHYLSYFNVLAGGPSGGYRYLGDSNLDWGQDLPALADEIARLGHPRVCLAYFGRAPVKVYGIEAADWRDSTKCREAEWLAVSATYLQGSFIDNDPFETLLGETPDRRAAYSIFLYRMDRPLVPAALERAWTLGSH